MSFSDLLERLLASIIVKLGPALLNLILKWLEALTDDDVEKIAQGVTRRVGDAIEQGKKAVA